MEHKQLIDAIPYRLAPHIEKKLKSWLNDNFNQEWLDWATEEIKVADFKDPFEWLKQSRLDWDNLDNPIDVAETKPSVETKSEVVVEVKPDLPKIDIGSGFGLIQSQWPPNPHFENPKHQERAWDRALRHYPESELVKACQKYINDFNSGKRKYALHLKTFLDPEDEFHNIQAALWELEHGPKAWEEKQWDEIWSVWSLFEDVKPEDKKEDFWLWTQKVPQNMRFYFLMVTVQYVNYCIMREDDFFSTKMSNWIYNWEGYFRREVNTSRAHESNFYVSQIFQKQLAPLLEARLKSEAPKEFWDRRYSGGGSFQVGFRQGGLKGVAPLYLGRWEEDFRELGWNGDLETWGWQEAAKVKLKMPSTYVGTAYTPPDVKWPEVELKWFMPSHTDNVDCWSGFIPFDTSYDRASQKMMLRKNMY